MKKLSKALLVLTGAALLLSGCGSKKSSALTFGTNAEFPPFEFVSSSGIIDQYDGIDLAIVKKIGEDTGRDVKIENMEFDSLLIALENGQIDAVISGMTITEERAKSVDFSHPYYAATQVMIVKEDSDITKATDMEGKKIVVIQGYTGELCVQDLGYKYEAFKKGTEAILELTNGKCDVVVLDSATAQKYVKDNPGLKIIEDPDAFETEEYGIAIKKGNTELLNQINDSIDKMLADGSIAEWSVKYSEAE
ncbi:MAG: basic amino acid ABC transporter substrate-binding protein [Lachnospiraceae bacterium]|nr:basic amino acid ABC transporter substrate-binding protein [Lachnospiraceae bacterium]